MGEYLSTPIKTKESSEDAIQLVSIGGRGRV